MRLFLISIAACAMLTATATAAPTFHRPVPHIAPTATRAVELPTAPAVVDVEEPCDPDYTCLDALSETQGQVAQPELLCVGDPHDVLYSALHACLCDAGGPCASACGANLCSGIVADWACKVCSQGGAPYVGCLDEWHACVDDVLPPGPCACEGPICTATQVDSDCNGDGLCVEEDAPVCDTCCPAADACAIRSYCRAESAFVRRQ
jgi:hypothetical protein